MRDDSRADLDQRPPFWGSWKRIYLVVAGELFLLVILFALLRGWAE